MKPFDAATMWLPELSPLEVVCRSALMYAFFQLVFRLAGRKELGRWGLPEVALLFLVTTAVRKSLVGDDGSVTSGMIALVTIVVLDRAVSVLTARSPAAADWIEGPVRQLVRDGRLVEPELRRARISSDELLARVRERGRERLEEIESAFLERSGKVTIVFRDRAAAPPHG